jgi:sporulation protein YlmC with PRC-barrel domain
VEVFRDLLDKQIIDRDGHKMGRVDGIVAEYRPGRPLLIQQLDLSWITLARRVHPRLETLAGWLHARLSIRQAKHYRVRWSDVKQVDEKHVKTALCFEKTPAADWELWLREKIIRRIPGSRIEQQVDEK